MSKEQTPIEELVIRLADLYTALVRSKRPDQGMKLVSIITKEIEQFTQAKVLEALEREVIEAHTQGQAFVIKQDNLKHGRYPIASIGYYENEVKPNYEK